MADTSKALSLTFRRYPILCNHSLKKCIVTVYRVIALPDAKKAVVHICAIAGESSVFYFYHWRILFHRFWHIACYLPDSILPLTLHGPNPGIG